MAQKVPFHRAACMQTIWLLIRMHEGERTTLGTYSDEDRGRTQAARIIASEIGLKTVNRLPWTPKGDAQELIHRRDRQIFWFRLEPWPVDAEVS